MRRLILLLILILSFFHFSQSAVFTLTGQASIWTLLSNESQISMRYIPELNISACACPHADRSNTVFKEQTIDANISLNFSTWVLFDSLESFKDNTNLDPYRLWLRYSTAQFGLRLGLQKINFGPAKILRSLMWFDQIDMRDPLKLTDGVYALLGRYYFLNNTNVWLWGLYGNDDLKGMEIFKSENDKMEFGGRCQSPLGKGEMAFSFNQRHISPDDWNNKMPAQMSDGTESRYAIDGNWDLGTGLWFETVANEIKIDAKESLWQKFLTLGTDYTFAVGPGIHVLYEHLFHISGSKIYKHDDTDSFSALLIDFSISILDRLNAIGYYDWEEKKVYTYIGLQRTYDNWQINLIGFSSKKNNINTFSGKGMQCMVTYNH